MKNLVKLLVSVMMITALCGCEGALVDSVKEITADGEVAEQALDFYEDLENHNILGATDPENTIDTPAANEAREEYKKEQEDKKKGDFYSGEATVTSIDGNEITMSYCGGSQGGNTEVSFSDPEHHYKLNATYAITVRTLFVEVTQLDPVESFGRFAIIKAPKDGR